LEVDLHAEWPGQAALDIVAHAYVLRAFGFAIALGSIRWRLTRCWLAQHSCRAPPASVLPAVFVAERHGWREVEGSVLIRRH
jgi:hypothetical protein